MRFVPRLGYHRVMRAADAPADDARGGRRLMLAALCFATFLISGSATIIAPFLLEIADELGTDLAAAGNLVAILSVTWGATSVVAGTASDRLGRRPLLLFGLLVSVASLVGVALSGSYALVALWRFIGGVGGGAYMGTVFAAVSDRFPPAERGRALGWIITGQSLSLALGVPLMTFVGGIAGWRGALVAQAIVTLVAVGAVALAIPRVATRRDARTQPRPSMVTLLRLWVVALLGAAAMERVCYAGVVVFLPTYLLASYGISLQLLAVALFMVALGNLVGNVIGGQLTDRLPSRPLLFAASLVLTGGLAVPLLLWRPGVELSVALGFLYSLVNALGRPALLASLSEVSSESRGALLGLNITFSGFGWLGATALGGWLIAGYGFEGLGLLTAATGLAGAALAIVGWLRGPQLVPTSA